MGGWTQQITRPAPPAFPRHYQGRYYGGLTATTFTTLAVTAGVIYTAPIFIPQRKRYTNIALEVTAGSASSVRLGMYQDSGGRPGALLFDAGAVSCATPNGARGIGIDVIIDPGWYWLACLFSATPTVRAISQTNATVLLGWTSTTDVTRRVGCSVAQAFGALPDPITPGSVLAAGAIPRITISPGSSAGTI